VPDGGLHHVALRVVDLARAERFYANAFGARRRSDPFLREGAAAEAITRGPAGVRFWMCHLELPRGGLLELISFEQPRLPARPVHPSAGNIVHLAIQVDSAAETLRLVEENGGSRVWPELRSVAGSAAQVIYVTDPDGNVVEAIEASVEELLEAVTRRPPPSAARRGGAGS
jgi:catechol 2,3-dioxygenase-like lactoylglutathione lyase family enzyme